MLRFKEFITETFLLEGRVDDLKAQNPGLHQEIDQYAAADTSPTKKFVPWLVSQHKKGNVTPDHPDLHAVVQNFDRYKNRHGIRDHSSKSFQEVHAAVMPLIGAGVTKAQVAHEGRLKIHDTGDIQAYHVQTKEASQHFYGGGSKLGGDHTTWCVSARSNECLFGNYGKTYTIHSKNDPDSPYAVHPEHNTITNRHNDGDMDIDSEINFNPKVAKLSNAIDAIQKHYDPVDWHYKNDVISPEEIDKIMQRNNYNRKKLLVQNKNENVALAALNHPNVDKGTVYYAGKNINPNVALAVIHHPASNGSIMDSLAEHPDSRVALAALNHPTADQHIIKKAVENRNPEVALAALSHPYITKDAVIRAAQHRDSKVSLTALKHHFANDSDDVVDAAVQHPDPHVAMTALNHPSASNWTTSFAVAHPNDDIALAALNHPKADKRTINYAVHPNQSPRIALEALKHHAVSLNAINTALEHPNKRVILAALDHPKAKELTSLPYNIVNHKDSQISRKAMEIAKQF